MKLADARRLKGEVRRALLSTRPQRWNRPSAATAIRLASSNDYRVAVLLATKEDLNLLEIPILRALLGGDVVAEVVGEPAAAAAPHSSSSIPKRLRIGAAVGHVSGGDGSLGFFATRRADGRRGFVSCNHVIALADEGRDGDAVLSPSRRYGGNCERDVIGALDGRYPRLRSANATDCAFAVLAESVAYDPAATPDGRLDRVTSPRSDTAEVSKVGCVTGLTRGAIESIEVDDIPVRYGTVKTWFDGVLQIASAGQGRFSAPGDSGSLIYTTSTLQPVGLLFATSYAGGPNDAGFTWAHPIKRVLDALDVDISLEGG